jgi:hypothetical protein
VITTIEDHVWMHLERFLLNESQRQRLEMTLEDRGPWLLTEVLARLGTTQREFSERLGIHHVTLCRMLSGHKRPSVRLLAKAAEIYNDAREKARV